MLIRFLLHHRGKATRSRLGKLGPPLVDQTFPYKIIQFENFEGGISHSTESITGEYQEMLLPHLPDCPNHDHKQKDISIL